MKYLVLLIMLLSVSCQKKHSDHDGKHQEKKSEHSEHGHDDDHDKHHDEEKHEHEKGHEEGHEEDHKDEHKDEHKHAHGDEHGEEANDKVGTDKAVTEMNEEGGMKLNEATLNLLNLKYRTLSQKQFEADASEVITNQNERFILVKRNNFFYKFAIKVLTKSRGKGLVDFAKWKSGDQLVLNNLGIMELTNTFINDDAHYGHGH